MESMDNCCLLFAELKGIWQQRQKETIEKTSSGKVFTLEYKPIYEKYGKREMEQRIVDIILEHNIKIAIFFGVKMYDLDLEFLKRLRRVVFIVFWNFDDEVYYDFSSKIYSQISDFVVTTDPFSANKYRQKGIPSFYNPTSYSREDYYPIRTVNKDIDVSFIGNIYKQERKGFLEYLRANDIKVEIFGKGKDNRHLTHEEMLGVINRSKINLNFTQVGFSNWATKDDLSYCRNRQIKGRPVAVALTGSFVLSEYAPGIEDIFEVGKEIDIFIDKEELLEKVLLYLKAENKRQDIALKGHDKALRSYEMEVLFPKIISSIDAAYRKIDWESRKSEDIVVYSNSMFQKNYATYRFYYVAEFLINKNLEALLQELKIILRMKKVKLSQAVTFIKRAVLYYLKTFGLYGRK